MDETLIDFKQLTLQETVEFMAGLDEKPFRARQARAWIFERGVSDFSAMSDLSKDFRHKLAQSARITQIKERARQVSADGTVKFLFELDDGHAIESVLIPDEKRRTLCVSTQVGCKLGCAFCLTGAGGFIRDLGAAEIIDQVIQARRLSPEGRVTNVVLMGMGEPLENYDNVLRALRVMTDEDFTIVGARRITLSTAGMANNIERLGREFPRVKLAVSLNACDDELRERLMPITRKYPLKRLIQALRAFPLPRGRRITLEYVMLAGVNDSMEDARKLIKIAKEFPSKINLIPYNAVPGAPFKRPAREVVEKFRKTVADAGLTAFIRDSRGADIMAACGQLHESQAGGVSAGV
ncbi:MAG: 23S rRNA (adenine(2503)-C(2))-methyltransferase RlmN [Nitrospinae bacterium]|nr:23S rRNA (adenine(2503)-C(2))-methyltransferase RlmN [Nitrospinota bacterium]